MVFQILLLSLLLNVLCAQLDSSPHPASGMPKSDVVALKDKLREDSLNSKEEIYSLIGVDPTSLLLLQMINLIKEVKEMKGLVRAQGEQITDMESQLSDKMTEMEKGIGSMITKVDKKVEVMRSEVRLISQQKLTWQNSTWQDRLFSEYAVDGVYTLSNDWNGLNPIQHPNDADGSKRNFMLIIDLGGLFKINTVKLWSRLTDQSFNIGVFVYADEELLGGIAEEKSLYNFRAKDKLYAREIYVKQSLAKLMMFREVQVFGSGPFDGGEV